MTFRRRRPARRRVRHGVRAAAATALATLAVLASGVASAASSTPGAVDAPSVDAPSVDAHSVSMQVLRIDPNTPAASLTPQPLAITVRLTNTTGQDLGEVSVRGQRGDPIGNQRALDDAIAQPRAPTPALAAHASPADAPPITAILGPHATTQVTFTTTAGLPTESGLCICADAIYPIYLTAHAVNDLIVGSTQTYMPAFKDAPQPLQVSWVWPLLERPHRLADDTVFLDDDLARSVASGGRLDRMLQVVETVGKQVPMTLLVDPELLDALQVMSTGRYQVQAPGQQRAVDGTGGDAAATWLGRLRTVLDQDAGVELSLTAPADPDVDSLSRNGLAWSSVLGQKAQARVTAALGGRTPPSDLSWPADGTLGADTLATLVRQGTRTVILGDKTLPVASDVAQPADALASVQTPAGPVRAAVTSTVLQRYVDQVLPVGGEGLAALPLLVSELAVRAVEDGANSHYVVLTAPRDLDPQPNVAVLAILSTATTVWSQPLALRQAVRELSGVAHGELVPQPRTGLRPATIDAARYVTSTLPGLTGMLGGAGAATDLLGSMPAAVQRLESADWPAASPTQAAAAAALRARVAALVGGVHLAVPANGTYTLGSSQSPLPITIDNSLDYAVWVRVKIEAVSGIPGFSASDIGVQKIDANHTMQLRVPVRVDRAGRIKVQVELLTPDNARLGAPIVLSVRSTALGEIGKIITILAAAVLGLALLVRFVRRWRARAARAATQGSAAEHPATVP